jgi:UDP-N-acetyl-2-amino-2-deoxyglucuronate dehydrogenase
MNETIGQSNNFALIGVGGYISPRHLQAIKETGNKLVAALDPKDSVGIIDRYFPQADFFTEFERFERHIEKLRRLDAGKQIDYVSICSPNYLHDAHIRFALRMGAHAICEKPLVIKPWNLDALSDVQKEYGKGNIYTILQLRVHPTLVELKNKIDSEIITKKKEIDLTYITPRGKWYLASWKGDVEKSGGVVMNIGVHFFDMLIWIFGKPQSIQLHYLDDVKASGFIELEKARVRWFLSTDSNDLPEERKKENKAYRLITIDGQELEFSEGFTDLHTEVYRRTLAGNGFGIEDVRPSINLVYELSKLAPNPSSDSLHPFLAPKQQVIKQSDVGITKGQNVIIGENVSVGKGTTIGNNVVIYKDAVIGENVRIDDNAVIGKLPMISVNSATTSQEILTGTKIGSGTMIGTGAVVYRGATIGENTLIADMASIREHVEIGDKTIIGKGTTIENKVKIGSFCKIQANVQIVPYSVIEDYVFISPGVITSNDKYLGRTEKRFSEFKGVTVKRGARLGVASIILPGVTIYEDALVGGGAVVMEDVPARMIVVGVPARIIKEVPSEQLLENQKAMGNSNTSADQSSEKIPFVDVRANYQSIKSEIDDSINQVISGGHFIMGDAVKDFETEMSSYLGSKAVSCASGSDALLLSLMALGIGSGDEVITSPFTFFSTAGAIARIGAKPVLVDIDERTLNIDPEKIRNAVTVNTKAIIPVHIFGFSCDMDRIMSVARECGLKVIEDACQAIGAEYKGRKLGTIGDLGVFSFFPTKNLGAMGDGGMVCTYSEELYQKIKMLRVHGAEKKYFHEFVGINSRLDTLQAAILKVKLRHLEGWNRKREEVSGKYKVALSDIVRVQGPVYGSIPCYHQFAIRTNNRDGLLNFLKESGIEASVYYPRPLHLQKCFEYLGYKIGDFPVSESVCNTVLSLPLFPEMTNSQVDFIIAKVREFLSQTPPNYTV